MFLINNNVHTNKSIYLINSQIKSATDTRKLISQILHNIS